MDPHGRERAHKEPHRIFSFTEAKTSHIYKHVRIVLLRLCYSTATVQVLS